MKYLKIILLFSVLSLILVVVMIGCTQSANQKHPDKTPPGNSGVVSPSTEGTTEPADTQPQPTETETDTATETEPVPTEEPEPPVSPEPEDPDSLPTLPDPICWGLSFGESGTQPSGPVSQAMITPYEAYYLGDPNKMTICITVDCGYENGNTTAILDALKKHHATATFFVTGPFVKSNPDLVRRMVDEGHTVGNHTYGHPNLTTISQEEFTQQLQKVEDLFYETTGKPLDHYLRPPQGVVNATVFNRARRLGYRTILWSLAYMDYEPENQPTHEAAFGKLLPRIHPGAVVLLHNTSKTNGEIFDELLTKWEEMGYSFKPLSAVTTQ